MSPARPKLRAAFALLYWEGAFAMAYETWISPLYIGGLAGELGVGISLATLLMALPWIGSIGQLLGVWAFSRTSSVKRYTLVVAALARALWTLPVILAAFWGYRMFRIGEAFPVERWLYCVAAVACGSALLASSSSVAWLSWMRGLVPSGFQGRFFGVRQRYVMAALVVSNFLAAFWVSWKPGGFWLGYGVIGVLALVAALLSTVLLAKVPAARKAGMPQRATGFFALVAEPLRDPRFLRVILYGAAFNFAIQLAGPFFPYFFTQELGVPMSRISSWVMLANLGCFAASVFWGRRIDLGSDPVRIIRWTGITIASSPFIYALLDTVAGPQSLNWVAPFEYILNGATWSGYLLAFTALLFRACPDAQGRNTAVYFSVHAALTGAAGACATILGGQIAQWSQGWGLGPIGGFRLLFLISAATRIGVATWLVSELLIKKPRAGLEGPAEAAV